VQIQDPPGPVTFSCIFCGLNFNQKEELYGHLEEFHTSELMVSNTMVINTEGIVSIPEMEQDEKHLTIPNFGSECDAS
jgi:hypothetical protein